MPTSLVKTPRDERLWQKAKDRISSWTQTRTLSEEIQHHGNPYPEH